MLQATSHDFHAGRVGYGSFDLWLRALSSIPEPSPRKTNRQTKRTWSLWNQCSPACVQAIFWKHVELLELCRNHVTSPPRKHATCGHSQNVDGCKHWSRLLQAPCFLFDLGVLMDSDALRHSKLETLEHICSRSQDTRKVFGLDPTDYLIPAIVTMLLAPDSGVWEQGLGWIPPVLLLSSSRAHRQVTWYVIWFSLSSNEIVHINLHFIVPSTW